MEEAVLLPQRLVVLPGVRLGGLESHVGVGDLGDGGEEEDDGEEQHEDGDREVDPLDVGQGAGVVKGEEDVGAEHGRDDGADAVEGLAQVDADLGVLGRSADGDVRVGRRLERAQAVADDEDADAEAGKAGLFDGRDGQEGAEA